jgi:MuDR family transposase
MAKEITHPRARKPPRIDEQFGVGQKFSTKSELKVKITDFHVQRNIELEVTNSSKSNLVMKCKDSNCPWRIYTTPNIKDIWEIRTNSLEHSYFDSATRANHKSIFTTLISPMYNGSIIMSDPAKINNIRRSKIHNPMVMDEIEGRINEENWDVFIQALARDFISRRLKR